MTILVCMTLENELVVYETVVLHKPICIWYRMCSQFTFVCLHLSQMHWQAVEEEKHWQYWRRWRSDRNRRAVGYFWWVQLFCMIFSVIAVVLLDNWIMPTGTWLHFYSLGEFSSFWPNKAKIVVVHACKAWYWTLLLEVVFISSSIIYCR
jgi:hypothetical protein